MFWILLLALNLPILTSNLQYSWSIEVHNNIQNLQNIDELFKEYNITFKRDKTVSDEELEIKKEEVKKVITPLLLNLKDTDSFKNLVINIVSYKDKVRWQFFVHTKDKREIRLNKNLDPIMTTTTLVHEIGHQLTYLIPQEEQRKFWKGCFVNKYAWSKLREDIAESFTYFFNEREGNKQECFKEKEKIFLSLFKENFQEKLLACKEKDDCLNEYPSYLEAIKSKELKSSYLYGVEWFTVQTTNKVFNIKEY